MAAPCSRMVNRSLFRQFMTHVRRTGLKHAGVRLMSLSCVCRTATRSQSKPGSVASPWKLYGAVCLQRLPVISQERNPVEDRFAELMHQMELERSLLSEHEQRLLEEAERVRRKQADNYDSDEEEADYGGQETITAQDQEDTWEQNLKHFQPALRDRDVGVPALGSVERCLGDSLVLLVQQTVAKGNIWLLPQAQWEAGETLRQTAERGLASLPEADFKATFLGNTPCGVYKYKFPKDVQTEGCVGAKVFFFKALLSAGSAGQKEPFLWAKKTELQGYLKPAYLEKVNRFILDL
ncbi:large ribosomal subunit protein mL46 [Salmo salar]|uniref:Large ribosomal subunit protein mL46 n=1 Tax=Salmo salar TaxID=8030 RepID=B5XGB0_SALSA|nr:39S ribosomal protein L46, mitochondrial [Salmo salar]ACI69880.1 39S ribosomal protein L46, mitochondrial precursor [Salmo salar]|eukprot:XP_014032195.1 PREDICTED: 39S ribosomal protein L46, mitochondrial [Salmo salar]